MAKGAAGSLLVVDIAHGFVSGGNGPVVVVAVLGDVRDELLQLVDSCDQRGVIRRFNAVENWHFVSVHVAYPFNLGRLGLSLCMFVGFGGSSG